MSSPSSSKRTLRSTDPLIDIYLVGSVLFKIPGAKLPSQRQLLQVMFYHTRLTRIDAKSSARLAVREALLFWEKARIPTKQEIHCIEKLEKLYQKWISLQKSCHKTSDTQRNAEKKFVDDLDDLFDIAHANAMQLIKDQEDKDFLLRQRQKGRPGCMLGVDMIQAAKEKRKSDRLEQEQQRKRKHVEMTQPNGSFI